MSKISIILGYRNRDKNRVKRCLEFISKQTYKNFEVIFVDYGSDEEYQSQIKPLVESFDFCHYVYNNTIGMPWNRSHSLNTGIRFSTGEYLLFGDVDILYPDNFLETLITETKENTHIYNSMYLLPEAFSEWEMLKNQPIDFYNTGKTAKGPAFYIKKEYMEKIGGFDEFYCFWGAEDRDLCTRLSRLGLKEKWLTNKTPMYHQWHPIASNTKENFFPEKWWDDMNIYYALNTESIERNETEWGKVFSVDNRPVLNRLNQKEMSVLFEGNSYDKSNCYINIIDEIKKLKKDEKFVLTIEKADSTKPVNLKKYLKLINKIAKKLFKTSGNDFDFTAINRDEKFLPEKDLFYLIWVLIRREKIIEDYFIRDEQKNLIIELVKKC